MSGEAKILNSDFTLEINDMGDMEFSYLATELYRATRDADEDSVFALGNFACALARCGVPGVRGKFGGLIDAWKILTPRERETVEAALRSAIDGIH